MLWIPSDQASVDIRIILCIGLLRQETRMAKTPRRTLADVVGLKAGSMTALPGHAGGTT